MQKAIENSRQLLQQLQAHAGTHGIAFLYADATLIFCAAPFSVFPVSLPVPPMISISVSVSSISVPAASLDIQKPAEAYVEMRWQRMLLTES